MGYTTQGDIRGECGHTHKTIEAAIECIGRDEARAKRGGGHGDRRVVRADGGDLDDDERAELAYIERGY